MLLFFSYARKIRTKKNLPDGEREKKNRINCVYQCVYIYIHIYFLFYKHSHTRRCLFPFFFYSLHLLFTNRLDDILYYHFIFQILFNKCTCSVLFCYKLTSLGKFSSTESFFRHHDVMKNDKNRLFSNARKKNRHHILI